MSDDFVEVLSRQLRAAAARDERRSPLARRLATVASLVPGAALLGAAALALVAVVVVAAGALVRVLTPEPVAPRAPKVIGRFAVAPGLGMVAGGFGSVWADDTDARELLRVDAVTRRVLLRTPVKGNVVVSAGPDAVWALVVARDLARARQADLRGPLMRIDPRSNHVVARIPTRLPGGEPFLAWGVRVQRDAVWLLGPDGVVRVDPKTNRITTAITPRSAYEVIDAAVLGDELLMVRTDGRLLRFDARTGAPTGATQIPFAGSMTVVDGALLMTNASGVGRIDPRTGGLRWRARVRPAAVVSAVATAQARAGGLLWLPTEDGRPGVRLTALDPATGRVRANVQIPDTFSTTGLTAVGGDLWLATPGGDVVVVRPDARRVERTS